MLVTDLEEQFDAFILITDRYLQPASPQEVNISSKTQAKIAPLRDRGRFSCLDAADRRGAFQAPLKDVVRLLEDNLLTKFNQTAGMLRRRQQLTRQASRECIGVSGTLLAVRIGCYMEVLGLRGRQLRTVG